MTDLLGLLRCEFENEEIPFQLHKTIRAMIEVVGIAEEQVARWYRNPPAAEGGDFLAGMHQMKEALRELTEVVGGEQ